MSRREGAASPRTRAGAGWTAPRGMTKSPGTEAVTGYSERSRPLAGGGGRPGGPAPGAEAPRGSSSA